MAKTTNFVYPEKEDIELFVQVLREGKYTINKYLPRTDARWFTVVSECIDYVRHTSSYENDCTLHEVAARILYKIAKRHELEDGNKRSAVIGVYLFIVVNDHYMIYPNGVKYQAKRVAATKGRVNEEIIKDRVSKSLAFLIRPMSTN
ncbi:MAG: type II toxin-antitoxin system death-on-curing family toxin [Minisyncoccia bacterium]